MDEVGGRERRNFYDLSHHIRANEQTKFRIRFLTQPTSEKTKKNRKFENKERRTAKNERKCEQQNSEFFSLLFNTMIMSVYSLGLHKLKV